MKTFLFALLLMSAPNAFAAHGRVHGMFGVGELYQTPGALRLGFENWEGGIISPTFYGVQKIFDASPHVYTMFGLGLGMQGSVSPGVTAGIGWTYSLWAVQLRAELLQHAAVNGYSHGTAVFGLGIGF